MHDHKTDDFTTNIQLRNLKQHFQFSVGIVIQYQLADCRSMPTEVFLFTAHFQFLKLYNNIRLLISTDETLAQFLAILSHLKGHLSEW